MNRPNTRRARPLPAGDRRRAIVSAVLPLLVRHGSAVTTRQMAAAADVAEGTLFRVFADKHALIHHAIEQVMDPEPVCRALSGIAAENPFEAQLAEAARILAERSDEVVALLGVLRTLPGSGGTPRSRPPLFVSEFHDAVSAGLVDLFERNRARLTLEPAKAAAVLRGLVFARSALPGKENLTVDEVVAVLLSGVARPAVGAPT